MNNSRHRISVTTTFWSNSTLAIRLSAVLHGGCLLGVVVWPERWLWFGAAVFTNHVLILLAVLLPRSQILGQNLIQLPAAAISRREIALTFDDGPDPAITPRILDMLAQYNAKASFFCVASRAEAYPELVRDIIRQGHSVENHTRHHANYFALLGWCACKNEVQTAQHILSGITGIVPQFFRAPMGFRNPLLGPILAESRLCYTSWTRRGFDATSCNPARILSRLLYKLHAGDILLLHDGISWPLHKSPHITLQVLPLLLQTLNAAEFRVVSLPMALAGHASEVVPAPAAIPA